MKSSRLSLRKSCRNDRIRGALGFAESNMLPVRLRSPFPSFMLFAAVHESPIGRFCCRNRRTDGAGRLMPFFEAIHCHPLDCAGDLGSTLLTLHAYAAHKGASGGGGRPT